MSPGRLHYLLYKEMVFLVCGGFFLSWKVALVFDWCGAGNGMYDVPVVVSSCSVPYQV